MNKTLKKFAIAILVAGATVTATKAPAVATTNVQVLDNVDIQLKVYSQGAVDSTKKALATTTTTLTTLDVIKQLALMGGFTVTPSAKLVYSYFYSNVLVGTPNTVVSNNLVTNSLTGGGTTNVYIVTTAGTNELSVGGLGATSNIFVISNSIVYGITNTPYVYTNALTNAVFTLSNIDDIYTVVASSATLSGSFGALPGTDGTTQAFTNGAIQSSAGSPLGYWVTIVPVFTASTTNIVITQYAPIAALTVTNITASNVLCVMPKSGADATLIEVGDWISSFSSGTVIYTEGGANLNESNFVGTNILTQAEITEGGLNINAVWPTNSPANPTLQTNLHFNPRGFAKVSNKLINLTVGGTAAEKTEFNTLSSETMSVFATGYIGGAWTTNTLSTNAITGLTLDSANNPGDYYFNGTVVTNNASGNYIGGPTYTPVLVDGTITVTYLGVNSAAHLIVPAAP